MPVCYSYNMNKNLTKPSSGNLERKTLLILTIAFTAVIIGAWAYALNLRRIIETSNSVVNVDVRALVEIEKIRNLAESQIATSRSFFLLGSTSLFDQQKKDKKILAESLARFEKQFSLPQVPNHIKEIETTEQQLQEYFDQGMEYRAKQTESKIVGQYFQSKIGPLRDKINKSLDQIVDLHNAELERTRTQATEAAHSAEVQIPVGMAWLTGLLAFLFSGISLLVLRMLAERVRKTDERNRLYQEAKKSVLIRDEVISAVAQDLKYPLSIISEMSEKMAQMTSPVALRESTEVIKSSVDVIDGITKDIVDQSHSEMGGMTLRLDQLGLDTVLDEARIMLHPLAKHRDIRLEFNSVNPPVLAFLDRERVLRVLSNLVGNALKFSPKNSKVVVKVRSDQQFVFVSIMDNGPGIPEKQLAGIFTHYWQAPKTAEQGAGIGLAIVKTIIEAHGGTVQVESHVGHGSTFTFSLPRRRPVGANIGKPSAAPVRHSSKPTIAPGRFRDEADKSDLMN